jgi:hypothetical protein
MPRRLRLSVVRSQVVPPRIFDCQESLTCKGFVVIERFVTLFWANKCATKSVFERERIAAGNGAERVGMNALEKEGRS